MSATTTAEPADTLLGRPQSALALRIRGTDRHGQVVRLQSCRVAVGSSPHCTLRLRAPGAAPWHCLILRGRDHTVVRRWNADTRLNDAAFDDAPLNTGDRLAIGPIEFEVLDDRQFEKPPAEVGSAATAAVNEFPAGDLTEGSVDQLRERLTRSITQSRARARRLIEQLHSIRGENAVLQRLVDSRLDEEEDVQQSVGSAL